MIWRCCEAAVWRNVRRVGYVVPRQRAMYSGYAFGDIAGSGGAKAVRPGLLDKLSDNPRYVMWALADQKFTRRTEDAVLTVTGAGHNAEEMATTRMTAGWTPIRVFRFQLSAENAIEAWSAMSVISKLSEVSPA